MSGSQATLASRSLNDSKAFITSLGRRLGERKFSGRIKSILKKGLIILTYG